MPIFHFAQETRREHFDVEAPDKATALAKLEADARAYYTGRDTSGGDFELVDVDGDLEELEAKPARRVKIVCPHCGSDNVSKDSSALWDVDAQAWTFGDVQDCETCQDCGAEGDCFGQRRPVDAPDGPAATSGEERIGDKLVFRWMIQGDRTPEIYGWLERDYSIVPGTGGFWRTANSDEALARCKAAFPGEFAKPEEAAR